MATTQVPKDKPSFSVIIGAGAVSNGTVAQNVTAAAGGGAAFVVDANVTPGVYSGGSANVSGISCGTSINPMSGDVAAFGVTSAQTSFIVYADAAWTTRATPETIANLTVMNAVGNNSILAYGVYNSTASTSNWVKTSTDGVTWTTRVTFGTTSNGPLSVANNIFFFGGTGTAVRTSTDGITWVTRTVPGTTAALSQGPYIAYANATYVASYSGGGVATSTDTITWVTRTGVGTLPSLRKLQYGAAGFIASYNSATAYAISTDGITWSTRSWSTDVGATAIGVITDGTKYLVFTSVAGSNSRIYSSTNFTTWTRIADAPFLVDSRDQSQFYYNGTFIIKDNVNTGIIAVSTDGITWATKNTVIDADSIGYGNNRFFAVANAAASVSTSADVSGVVKNTAVVNLVGTKPTAIF